VFGLRERERERERESGKSVCGDLLICIPLFIESFFEVPLKKEKKEKKGSVLKKQKKEKKKRRSKGLIHCVCFSLLFGVVFCDFLCVQARVSSTV
jgi:hypothetical protein